MGKKTKTTDDIREYIGEGVVEFAFLGNAVQDNQPALRDTQNHRLRRRVGQLEQTIGLEKRGAIDVKFFDRIQVSEL